MAFADAIEALIADWPAVNARLDPEDRETARRLLAAFVHGRVRQPLPLLSALLAHQPPDHAAKAALRSPTRRAPGATQTTGYLLMSLRRLIELSSPEDLEPDAGRIADEAEHSIWLVPMRTLGGVADTEGPLVLEREGERYTPEFQFDAHGDLRPEAVKVNALLDAAHDPWGAASWWLSPHAGLHAIPADAFLAGRVEDVVAAAAATRR